ncbi:oxidoreductase [Longivirga aurantiaca]|uniref:Oxidoreductase n=1 Tax=Longivirga aurantiaca TaxID=1837743 RepID=A0ABW1SYS7_9ACTN
MSPWTAADIPDLSGRRALVTGANSGIGYVTALELARHGADVLLGVRDAGRGEDARARIAAAVGTSAGSVAVVPLDLADLASVRACAETVGADPLHLLVNNAGVMAIPRRETADGFEMQLGTNHLGHMALTLGLLPALARAGSVGAASRVVTVSSNAHKMGRIRLDDLMGRQKYQPWVAYGQSKLANLLLTFELQHRLDAAGLPVGAYAAHPGYAATNLQSVAPAMKGSSLGARFTELGNRLLAQPAEMGALPTLYVATEPGLPPASYAGPDGFFEQHGHPRLVGTTAAARDTRMAAALWEESEALVGVRFDDVVAGITA